MKDRDDIFRLFTEANPARGDSVSTIKPPDADTILLDRRGSTLLEQGARILASAPVEPHIGRRWGPTLALASFAVVVAAVGIAVWLGSPGADRPVASDAAPAPVATTVATTSAPIAVTVPDLVGMTLGAARALAEQAGLDLVALPAAVDSAIVVAQDPAPGVVVSDGGAITVESAVAPLRPARDCTAMSPSVPGAGQISITVLFECGGDDLYPTPGIAVSRLVPEQGGEAIDRIEWTLRSLLAGPSEQERAAGFFSFFDEATASALNGVTLSDGNVVADFNDAIFVNNASTSTGGLYFNAELLSNLFQHPEVDSVEFRVNGDCGAWSTLFQSDGCWIITRAVWDQRIAEWDDLRSQ